MLVDTLAHWQKTINLAGRAAFENVEVRHDLGRAQLLPLIPPSGQNLGLRAPSNAAPVEAHKVPPQTMTAIQPGPAAFTQGMAQLGVAVSRETVDRLQALVDTLARWQKTINLVGRTTLEDVWVRHVLDSAQLLPLIPDRAETLVDLGSGAGFPGLVIAALAPRLDITLIEADARKAAFLGEASRRMGLAKAPRIRIGRIEAIAPSKSDVITARALAPLSQLLAWAGRHQGDTTICLFHKGKGWQAELTEAMKSWDTSFQPSHSVTDLDAVILRLGHFTPRGTGT